MLVLHQLYRDVLALQVCYELKLRPRRPAVEKLAPSVSMPVTAS